MSDTSLANTLWDMSVSAAKTTYERRVHDLEMQVAEIGDELLSLSRALSGLAEATNQLADRTLPPEPQSLRA